MKVTYSLIIKGVIPCGSDYTTQHEQKSDKISVKITEEFRKVLSFRKELKAVIVLQHHEDWKRGSRKAIAYKTISRDTTKEEVLNAIMNYNNGYITEEQAQAVLDRAPLDTIITLEEEGLLC